MSDFYNEVKTQPEKLRGMLARYRQEDFASIKAAAALIRSSGTVVFSGMGTSFHAPLCVYGKLCARVRPVILEAGELLESCLGIIHPGDVVVLISQSGESVEIDRLTEKLRGTAKIIGITNQPDSILARASSVLLLLHAGPEKSITNKTFTNTMALLYLLECCVAEGLPETLCGELDAAVPEMERVLRELPAEIAAAAKTLAPADMVHFIGRGGAAMTVANQSALIFMEGANCAARAFTSGGFHHGPIEICGPGHRAVFYANEPETFPKMLELARQIAGYGSHVVMVTNLPCELPGCIQLHAATAEQFAMASAMVMELLLVRIAENRGLTAGEFQITNKICQVD